MWQQSCKVVLRTLANGTGAINKSNEVPQRAFHQLIKQAPRTSSSLTQRRNRSTAANPQTASTTLEHVASMVKDGEFKNILVMAGAGISVHSGIPDFTSPGTGLYDNLQKYSLPYPKAIFDIDYFYIDPKPFYTLTRDLYLSKTYRPNHVHYFLRLLDEKGLLFKVYTQNFDGLERLAGIPENKLMEAHGNFHTASCTTCLTRYTSEELKTQIQESLIPKCQRESCDGMIKPDMVFIGEELPAKFWLYPNDMRKADLALIMGTSLQLHIFNAAVQAVPKKARRVLFNLSKSATLVEHPRDNDIFVEGDIRKTIFDFCDILGWREDLERIYEEGEKGHSS